MRNLKELNKLERYLREKGIRYERIDQDEQALDAEHPYCILKFERHQVCVPCEGEGREWDVICHKGSYGADEGLLEIMGSIVTKNVGDTVEGWLTAEDVIERIERYRED